MLVPQGTIVIVVKRTYVEVSGPRTSLITRWSLFGISVFTTKVERAAVSFY